MPTVIIIEDNDLDSYYNYVMQYLDEKYHQFPEVFQDFRVPDELEGLLSSMNVMASHIEDGEDDGYGR